ncbi:DUF2599 domain-containing protein [Cellulomonas phragmiteti]|uniref:DUF2599 domain-containing protein n=1 Tax=Cellulomonas phragmiteti TaxID=478780 RepID=A0ABQ4DP42_9CELL|nr:DUF2599 domain-containing protein [Cellulomonas phragmiteti]GIG41119.1 hypothetical protein Cph01nite_28810 [Cellulomonas phragmiteti]
MSCKFTTCLGAPVVMRSPPFPRWRSSWRITLALDLDAGVAQLELADDVTVAIPVGDSARVGELTTGDAVVVTEEDTAFAALEKDDGSVQVIYSITGQDSPTHYPFTIDADDDAQWHTLGNGGVVLLDQAGRIVLGAAAPWAVDAAGVAVPTRFEVTDGVITQVVDHRTEGVTYPVVADPWLGIDLFSNVWRHTDRGDLRVNATKSTWGQAMHLPAAGNLTIFFTAGWAEVAAKQPRVTEKLSLHQQYECHVAGGYFNLAGDWNLEKFRPNRPNGWGRHVASHRCNWLTANGGERG